jgi:hypothetical protein
MSKVNEITVDGTVYVPKGSEVSQPAVSLDGMKFCIIRTYSAGVFAGYIKERIGKEATIINAIRLWYWAGAASLSQLSQDGVAKPDDCKFGIPMPEVTVTEAIEIIPTTAKAQASIQSVKSWSV